MKYRIYIDEVGNSDIKSSIDPNHRFLCLTGVVFDLDYIKSTVSPDIDNLKMRYFNSHPDDPIILHRKELVNKKYPFHALKNSQLELDFNTEFIALFKKWNFKTITVLVDKLEHQNKYTTWRHDPYHYCMSIIFERYHLRLKELNVTGDMMFESRGGKEDSRLKESYRNIFRNGTDWIKPNEIDETLTSKELKIKPKSANITGLQIADLLAYPIYKYSLEYYFLKQKTIANFNDKIMNAIEDKIFRNGTKIDGYGIKLLP